MQTRSYNCAKQLIAVDYTSSLHPRTKKATLPGGLFVNSGEFKSHYHLSLQTGVVYQNQRFARKS